MTKGPGGVSFTGKLTVDAPGKLDTSVPVFLSGRAPAGLDPNYFASIATVNQDGTFKGVLGRTGFTQAICIYAGTDTPASSTSGYLAVPR